jgi:hypothetical protein
LASPTQDAIALGAKGKRSRIVAQALSFDCQSIFQ